MEKRVIKFRAWDNIKKKMYQEIDIITPDDGRCVLRPDGSVQTTSSCSRYNIMQFTGLLDRFGKDIYEDDIIKLVGGTCNFLPCGIYPDQKHEIGAILIVSKLPSGFTLQLPHHVGKLIPNMVGNVDNYLFWNHQQSLEVVGNIHEHKHLIEKK